ncbi:hypothetical protein TrLO_g13445 [Triparma laevis f. longispina]|uniref:Uncharacterized protein n=1 Tax=Triparma laevis f. longispina TaxID=1714387 RepID=A0A9W7L0C9_9STRA|nr:hypothetical protein TrLO_g13445 [Triparma laevis f. longispina]
MIPHLKVLKNLRTLDLRKTRKSDSELISDLGELKGLRELRELNVSYNKLITSLPVLNNLKRLEGSLTGIRSLRGLEGVEEINLKGCRVADDEILRVVDFNSFRVENNIETPGTGAVKTGEKCEWKKVDLSFNSQVTTETIVKLISKNVDVKLEENENVVYERVRGKKGVSVKEEGGVVPRGWRGRMEGVAGVVIEQS